MDGCVSGKALIGGALLALAVSASACVGAGGQDMAAYPKFSDIPKKPTPRAGVAAESSTLQAMAAALAGQDASTPAADAAWSEKAKALAAIPAAGAADIDSEAFARAARARATPPPSRK